MSFYPTFYLVRLMIKLQASAAHRPDRGSARIFFPVVVVLLVLLSCGLGDKVDQLKGIAENLEDAADKLQAGDTTGARDAFGRVLGGGEAVDPVDFRTLRALLPENLTGFDRTHAGGETGSMMGIGTSKAEAQYFTADQQGRIDVTITDLGSVRGIGMFGVNWLMMEIDRESERGYERTLRHQGYPAYQKYERGSDWSRGEMSLFVADRFVVTVSGQNVEEAAIHRALDRIELRRLEAMRNEGVRPVS